jgi:hypothetical protein
MTRSHRQRHRIIWIALAVLLPLVLIAGLVARRPVPVTHGVGNPLVPRPANLSPR